MRSLFLKFFVSFWLVIGLIVGAAAFGGFLYAERLRDTIDDFEVGSQLSDASEALANGGRNGLVQWIRGLPRDDGVLVFVIDEVGNDLVGRRVPYAVRRYVQRHRSRMLSPRADNVGRRPPSRWSRQLPQLTGPDGHVYTMLVTPARSPESFWSNSDIRGILLLFALLTSGLVSYGLATAFARPVRRLREATVALADGNLDVRVANSVSRRRDELGMLGLDFDRMASQLQRSAEQQTELSRNISHELRSPLARMRVAVELARRKAGDLAEFERLDADAERLDNLIGQILSYTRLHEDPQTSDASVDVADVLREVAENVNFENRAARVEIDVDRDEALSIRGYRPALVSAFENIVRNAIRHSPADASVEVTLKPGEQELTVEVRDTGPGVEASDLEHLFEPFFRTRASAEQDANGGTGLGLAIARRAVEQHGGRISAENGDDGGLVVRVTLPSA